MSAFLVSDTVINRVVTALAADPYFSRDILASQVPFDLATPDGQCALAETMFRLNIDAIEQRYGKARAAAFRPLDFAWKPERATRMEAFEALCCWVYQCREGNVPETSKLFQLLEKIRGRIAIDIDLMKMPKGAWPVGVFQVQVICSARTIGFRTQLFADSLESSDAKAFLEAMPTAEQLMSAITVEEMQNALISSKARRISERTQ